VAKPKYRGATWLDTSPESLRRDQARILYGVQIKMPGFTGWRHLHDDGEPCLFEDEDDRSMFIDLLRLSDREEFKSRLQP
jgi:ligand-binding SRPBCC domain-containing protein